MTSAVAPEASPISPATPLERISERGITPSERVRRAQEAAQDSLIVGLGPTTVPGWTVKCGIRQELVNTIRCDGCCASDQWSTVAREQVRSRCPVWQRWRQAKSENKGVHQPPIPQTPQEP